MPGREYGVKGRYGFNGKENNNEVKGEGNQQDYGMRIYDPRIARFLSEDPITASYPMLTPYQFASNRPIDGVDIDGKEWAQETTIKAEQGVLVVENHMVVKVKVKNSSTLVTDPNIIKAKAELFKTAVEAKYSGQSTVYIFGIPFINRFKTEVILDHTAASSDDLPSIGHLIFDDRVSTKSEIVTNSGINTITTTNISSTPGETKGMINQFTISIGITMDGKMVKDDELINTSQHEGGHSAGLNHPWKLSANEKNLVPQLNQNSIPPAEVKKIKDNLLNSAENPDPKYRANSGSEILPGQKQAMNNNIKEKSYYSPAELKATKPKN